MSEEGVISRGEFEMLRQVVASNQARMESIDSGGTRGIGVIDAKLTEVVRDLATLQSSVDSRFEAHNVLHETDRKDRISGRRWAIGTSIAIMTALIAMLALIADMWTHFAH